MNIQSTTGIVLKLTKLTDTSLIVTWFTRDLGKVKTVAKGARRPKSPFLGKLDLFYLDDLTFIHSRRSELHILKECAVTDAFSKLREDFSTMARASYLCELVDATTEVEHPVAKLFDALEEGLRGMGEWENGGQREIRVRKFELALFEATGHSPRLTKCAKCNNALAGDVFFAARAGGAFCGECGQMVSPKFKVSAESLRLLREISRGVANVTPTETQLRHWEQVSAAMLKEVFNVWPKSRQFLKTER
jgi:DNA repair protein RecO (recombination protein O)